MADMGKRYRAIAIALTALALVAASNNGGAHLKLALEDRADPNPRDRKSVV